MKRTSKILTFILAPLLLLTCRVNLEAQSSQANATRALAKGIRVHYNRVEGISSGYRITLSPKSKKEYSIFAQTSVGFSSRAVRWESGITYTGRSSTLSLTIFDRTETWDRGIIRNEENSFFAALFKGDYRDYFRARNGFELKGTHRFRPRFSLLGRLTAFKFFSMPVKTEWSIFRNNRPFRVNPPVQSGDLGLIQIGFSIDTRRRRRTFQNAWFVTGLFERGFREFVFNGFILDATRHQKLIFGNQAVIIHGRIASRQQSAEQFLFELGGVGTLRGFSIKKFEGNRMLLLNIDYLLRGDLLGKIPLKGSHLANLVLFLDTGWVTLVPRKGNVLSGFQNIRRNEIRTNLGFAIGITERLLRFNVARRLNRSDNAWTYSVRFVREF